MALKIKKPKYYLFVSLIMFSFTFSAHAQTITQVNPADYGGSYKVRSGDTVQYNTTKFIGPTNEISIIAYNLTPIMYNTSIGTITTITIKNITLVDNVSEVFSNVNLINNRTDLNLTVLTNQSSLLGTGFTNENKFIQYINAEHSKNLSPNGYNQTIVNSQVYGDYYNEVINLTSSYPALTIMINETINWKTGWVQSYDRKQFASDGTLYSETMEVIISNNPIIVQVGPLTSTLNQINRDTTIVNQTYKNSGTNNLQFLSYTNLAFILGLTTISAGLVVLVVSFINYLRIPDKKGKKITFNNYLKKKITNKEHKKKILPNQTEKALEMIEEIIKDSQE